MQIDHDLLLLLTGAAIALASAVITALVQHILSLREDRIKRGRDEQATKREHLAAIPPGFMRLLESDRAKGRLTDGEAEDLARIATVWLHASDLHMRQRTREEIADLARIAMLNDIREALQVTGEDRIDQLRRTIEELITEQPEAKAKPQAESPKAEEGGK